MKKNILFVSATSEIGGADLSLLDIIKNLDRELFNPVVVFPFDGPLIYLFREAGAKVLICNTGYIRRDLNILRLIANLLRIIYSIWGISRIIRKFSINLVHSNSSIVFGGALAAKICGVSHIWHVREIKTSPRMITSFIKVLIVFLSARVIAISNAVKNSFSGIPGFDNKITVINDGVDLKVFYPKEKSSSLLKEFGIKDNARVIGAIGLILPLKGYDFFLRAAELTAKEFPGAVFMIVGDTVINRHEEYRECLKDMVKDLGLTGKVVFTGMRQDIPDFISLMDISVLASVEPEGMGRVIVESMAMGKPVITTNLGGQAEAITDGFNGLLVPPCDPFSLAQGIISLLKDSRKSVLIGQNGRKIAVDKFDLVKKVRELEGVFLSLC